jgi:DNA-binding NtrC family response regulator
MSERKNPVDQTTVADDPVPGQTRAFALLVTAGPEAGKRFFFDDAMPPRPLLGKGHLCELRLGDPSVSRRHAAFEITPHGLRVTDLGSTNGTFVGSVRVADAWVGGGQTLKVGGTSLQVIELPGERVTKPSTAEADGFGRLLGRSAVMRRLYPLFERAAQSNVPVLIEGETGTGKELLAECLHENGPRAAAPFVVFDCAAVSPASAEAALFGTVDAPGLFEQARGGTVLLDEIGELDTSVQPRLVRAIEKGELQRAGSTEWVKVDVRVLCTTRRDLDKEVQEGRFRDDLYYRLAVLRLELPPLRTRLEDVRFLAEHFHRLAGGDAVLPKDLVERFAGATWPDNVRELANLVTRRVAMGEVEAHPPGAALGADPIEQVLAMDLPLPRAREQIVDAFERRYLERVLARHGGNVGRAAAASGIARRYFQILRARHREQT